jgi:hypothetical protein
MALEEAVGDQELVFDWTKLMIPFHPTPDSAITRIFNTSEQPRNQRG